ncbi:uncharacterized protein PY1_contig_16_55 [Novosphingobium sp. PY1]|nr:hypothetical protein [Novosphingobium sp. PY1]GFM31114.1 uncharacterized protein PY1_contig_16_55 [Novosphingobium sp. PY1]
MAGHVSEEGLCSFDIGNVVHDIEQCHGTENEREKRFEEPVDHGYLPVARPQVNMGRDE